MNDLCRAQNIPVDEFVAYALPSKWTLVRWLTQKPNPQQPFHSYQSPCAIDSSIELQHRHCFTCLIGPKRMYQRQWITCFTSQKAKSKVCSLIVSPQRTLSDACYAMHNFTYLIETNKSTRFVWHANEKQYHSQSVRVLMKIWIFA